MTLDIVLQMNWSSRLLKTYAGRSKLHKNADDKSMS